MKNLIYILVLFPYLTFAQSTGFFGHKTYINIDGLGSFPLIQRIREYDQTYVSSGNTVKSGEDNFNYGYRLGIARVFDNKVSLGFEFGQDYANIAVPTEQFRRTPSTDPYYYYDEYYLTIKHEMMDIKTTSFIPKIEFAIGKALLPMGLTHMIGIGFTNTEVLNKDYKYKVVSYDNYYTSTGAAFSDSDYQKYRYNINKSKYKGYSIIYSFYMRQPISKHLLLNFGMRYNLNLTMRNYNNDGEEYWIGNFQLTDVVKRTRSSSIMSLNLGMTFAF